MILKEKPRALFALFAVLAIASCRQTPPPAPPAPPQPAPAKKTALEKTFGEARCIGAGTLLIRYKDIQILVDPSFEPSGTALGGYSQKLAGMTPAGEVTKTKSPAMDFTAVAAVDYLFLTDAQPHHFGPSARAGLRKNLKAVAPPDAADVLRQAGFSQVKPLSPGQRVLLKKSDAFLFASAVQYQNAVTGRLVNGYLLEFDNGRNLFVSGEMPNLDALRQFVYGLRDDGKEIHLAFIDGGGFASADGSPQSCTDDLAAQVIGLIQPQVAFLLETDSLSVAKADGSAVRHSLDGQLFLGEFAVAAVGEKIDF